MKIEKVAEGAYFVPSYSEQTIAWSPFSYTIQGLVFDETFEERCADTEPAQVEQEQTVVNRPEVKELADATNHD